MNPHGPRLTKKHENVTLNLVLNSFQYCFRVSNEEMLKQY